MNFFRKAWTSMIFWAGDMKKLSSFPYFTWDTTTHLIDFDEVLEVLPLIKYGDVGLHRERGYLSNVAIPGFMKHAWIHVEDDFKDPKIVEATSDGVILRNAIHPILSDYTIILSPKNVSEEERKGACTKAMSIVGAQYDVNFKFDIEEELKFYADTNKEEAIKDLKINESNMKKYIPTFSCTEAVSYSWWHRRETLGLFRSESRGKNVIKPDTFLNTGWEIKWMSKSVTTDVAKELGLNEEGIFLIESYLGKHK